MGWWGDRAKDGDSPMDYWGDFKELSRKNPNAYLRKRMVKADSYTLYAVFGCATLMIENGYKVKPELLKQIREKLSEVDEDGEYRLCRQDEQFYKTYITEGKVLTKKPFKVMVEVRVEGFDEQDAIREAGRWVDNGLSRWAGNTTDRVNVQAKVA